MKKDAIKKLSEIRDLFKIANDSGEWDAAVSELGSITYKEIKDWNILKQIGILWESSRCANESLVIMALDLMIQNISIEIQLEDIKK